MDLRNCMDCGRPFLYAGVDLCVSCLEKEEEAFDKLRDYLRDHPGADVETVAKATGVAQERILRFVRKGRLETNELGQMELGCVLCGTPIPSGRYCNRCSASLLSSFRSAEGSEETKSADKPADGGRFSPGRHFYVAKYLKDENK